MGKIEIVGNATRFVDYDLMKLNMLGDFENAMRYADEIITRRDELQEERWVTVAGDIANMYLVAGDAVGAMEKLEFFEKEKDKYHYDFIENIWEHTTIGFMKY